MIFVALGIYVFSKYFLPTATAGPKIESSSGEMIALETRDPVVSNIGSNLTVLNFVDVTLKCEVSGIPAPTITWFKDGRELSEVSDSDVLVISEGGLAAAGKYTCTATNTEGEVSADSFIKFVGESSVRRN